MIKKFDIWLLWSLDKRGNLALRAVDTSQSLAKKHKIMIEGEFEHPIIKAWIEKRDSNHCYGHMPIT